MAQEKLNCLVDQTEKNITFYAPVISPSKPKMPMWVWVLGFLLLAVRASRSSCECDKCDDPFWVSTTSSPPTPTPPDRTRLLLVEAPPPATTEADIDIDLVRREIDILRRAGYDPPPRHSHPPPRRSPPPPPPPPYDHASPGSPPSPPYDHTAFPAPLGSCARVILYLLSHEELLWLFPADIGIEYGIQPFVGLQVQQLCKRLRRRLLRLRLFPRQSRDPEA